MLASSCTSTHDMCVKVPLLARKCVMAAIKHLCVPTHIKHYVMYNNMYVIRMGMYPCMLLRKTQNVNFGAPIIFNIFFKTQKNRQYSIHWVRLVVAYTHACKQANSRKNFNAKCLNAHKFTFIERYCHYQKRVFLSISKQLLRLVS